MHNHDTIAAISTPAGSGGISIVRLSGRDSKAIAQRVFRPLDRGRQIGILKGYTGVFGRVYDQAGEFDQAVAFAYTAPRSYTGEDVVELCCHGGFYVTRRLLRACLDSGARAAAPGEFTKRAALNGKLTLTQAEAVMDVIGAQGEKANKAAMLLLDGELHKRISAASSELVSASARIAAWIDYPEEDISDVSRETLSARLENVKAALLKLLDGYDGGRVYRGGISAAIIGRPNVGKSTLMNMLSGCARSIVTEIPGTTRDVIEDRVQLGELILSLADTAGLRQTDDPIESVGVAFARKKLASCDLALVVFDGSAPLTADDLQIIDELGKKPAVAVINKCDLKPVLDARAISDKIPHIVELSAKAGTGIELLSAAISSLLELGKLEPADILIANERQRACVKAAVDALETALSALAGEVTIDAVDVCLSDAINHLLTLTGERASDRVVDEVFAKFCVGK